MLFNVSKDRFFESYKERNLYYKFFAGYYFNELIQGCQERLDFFYNLLKNPDKSLGAEFPKEVFAKVEETHVSFDNHECDPQLITETKAPDRGEFADILIQDHRNQILIVIEVKYLSDWNHQRDIIDNRERILRAKERFQANFSSPLQVFQSLLLVRSKFKNAYGQINKAASNAAKLEKYDGHLIVLLWDRFLDYMESEEQTKSIVSEQGVQSKIISSFLRERLDYARDFHQGK